MATLKKYKTGFVQVPNSLLNDESLSFKAKGIYSFLASKPDGWDFEAGRIAKQTADGRRAVLSGIKELEEKGYLNRKKLANGHLEYELLANINLSAKTARCRNRTVLKPHSAKTDTISNIDNIAIKKDSNKDIAFAKSKRSTTFKKEDYDEIIKQYEYLKDVNFVGSEYLPIQQAIKSMFLDGRNKEDITALMEALNSSTLEHWQGWTIQTVKKQIPLFLSGKLKF